MSAELILVQPLRERLERAAECWYRAGMYDHVAAIRFALQVLNEEASYYRTEPKVPRSHRFRLSKWFTQGDR